MKNTGKTFAYYMSLPYRVVLEPSPEGGWITSIPNLPGCITQGENQEEALHLIEDAKVAGSILRCRTGIYSRTGYKGEIQWKIFGQDTQIIA